MKIRIIGLIANGEVCVLSGEQATGYIEINEQMTPANLSLLGEISMVMLGTFVTVPVQFENKIKKLQKCVSK